jgi:hypothetical protein
VRLCLLAINEIPPFYKKINWKQVFYHQEKTSTITKNKIEKLELYMIHHFTTSNEPSTSLWLCNKKQWTCQQFNFSSQYQILKIYYVENNYRV